MNQKRHYFACLIISVIIFAACDKTPSPAPLTIDETTAQLFTIESLDVDFPNETLNERAARIRKIAEPHGLTVSISDSLSANPEVNEIRMSKVSFPILMKYTCGNRKIRWRVISGGVEFFYNNDYRDIVDGENTLRPNQ